VIDSLLRSVSITGFMLFNYINATKKTGEMALGVLRAHLILRQLAAPENLLRSFLSLHGFLC
jgi:hypothetical protein